MPFRFGKTTNSLIPRKKVVHRMQGDLDFNYPRRFKFNVILELQGKEKLIRKPSLNFCCVSIQVHSVRARVSANI